MNKGFFVTSLDFELLWGVFDVINYNERRDYFRNTRNVIPDILSEFEKYDIHATWAVVGMLANQNWQEWNNNHPVELPSYERKELSAYVFGRSVQAAGTEDMLFAPKLIRKIQDTEGQEIATHTYSHYYCLEQGQTIHQFEADLKQAVKIFKKLGINLKSLVFPRNQITEEYLKICAELGIENVRSNPTSWYWKDTVSDSLVNKLARSGDAYLPFGEKSYRMDQSYDSNLPWCQKASRFLRPVESNSILRKLKLRRIKKEMTYAASHGKIYHLWWHPHNFGEQPEESMVDLKEILSHFKICREKYDFRSVTMQELNNFRNRI